VFEFVSVQRASFPVTVLCELLGVSTSGFYAWLSRPKSKRTIDDEVLTCQIVAIHERSRGNYGAVRVFKALRADDTRVGCKRVARLMRNAGLQGAYARKKFRTTIRDDAVAPAPDLVERAFVADAPNRLWVADITYVPTWSGWLYLAVVLDVFSRRVVGWSMREHLRTELVVEALEMALWNRTPGGGLVHHSDRGCQYTSFTFGRRLLEAGIVPSMGSVGDAYDNALVESFFATLEKELLSKNSYRNRTEARISLFDYIEVFYNRQRMHSSIEDLSPADFERKLEDQEASVA